MSFAHFYHFIKPKQLNKLVSSNTSLFRQTRFTVNNKTINHARRSFTTQPNLQHQVIHSLDQINTLEDHRIDTLKQQLENDESFEQFYQFDDTHNYKLSKELMQSVLPIDKHALANKIGKVNMHIFFPTTRYHEIHSQSLIRQAFMVQYTFASLMMKSARKNAHVQAILRVLSHVFVSAAILMMVVVISVLVVAFLGGLLFACNFLFSHPEAVAVLIMFVTMICFIEAM